MSQHYCLTELLGYGYLIVYKLGRSNQAADALAWRDSPTDSELLILLFLHFEFLTQLKTEIATFTDL